MSMDRIEKSRLKQLQKSVLLEVWSFIWSMYERINLEKT